MEIQFPTCFKPLGTSIKPIKDNGTVSPRIRLRDKDVEHLPDMMEKLCQERGSAQFKAGNSEPFDGRDFCLLRSPMKLEYP